jgi:hypothetical protein
MAIFVPINDIRPFNSYIANAGETTFVFDWFVFRAEYVKVYKNDIPQVYLSDYTVPNISVGSATGGTIAFVEACKEGDAIVIFRESEIKRTSSYTESGEFRASAVNNDFSYLVTICQELRALLNRCVILSPTDADTLALSLQLPKLSARIGKYLAFDQNGTFVAMPSTSNDLFYSWVNFNESGVIAKETKKAYVEVTEAIEITLPEVGILDDGREIEILNSDRSESDIMVSVNSDIITLDGETSDTIEPGSYRKYIYIHTRLMWLRFD